MLSDELVKGLHDARVEAPLAVAGVLHSPTTTAKPEFWPLICFDRHLSNSLDLDLPRASATSTAACVSGHSNLLID